MREKVLYYLDFLVIVNGNNCCWVWCFEWLKNIYKDFFLCKIIFVCFRWVGWFGILMWWNNIIVVWGVNLF